jgi:hypothetical protein
LARPRSQEKKFNKIKKFFFEKKNQKTFVGLAAYRFRARGLRWQSFFAAFCSQKEVLSLFGVFWTVFGFKPPARAL